MTMNDDDVNEKIQRLTSTETLHKRTFRTTLETSKRLERAPSAPSGRRHTSRMARRMPSKFQTTNSRENAKGKSLLLLQSLLVGDRLENVALVVIRDNKSVLGKNRRVIVVSISQSLSLRDLTTKKRKSTGKRWSTRSNPLPLSTIHTSCRICLLGSKTTPFTSRWSCVKGGV